MELSHVNEHPWVRYGSPFHYVYGKDVFTEEFYQSLVLEFKEILARGLEETNATNKFSRNMGTYDCYGFRIDDTYNGNLSVFGTPEWSQMLGEGFGIAPTGHVSIMLHHHSIGSKDGWIHNDFNPAWYRIREGSIQHPEPSLCNYRDGSGPLSEAEKLRVVRAVAMIYYLNNDGWSEGMGGETGLFDSRSSVGKPVIKIPPVNNSILMYECTPRSWHTFLKNHVQTRNSVTMWIHRTMEDAMRVGKEEELVGWRK